MNAHDEALMDALAEAGVERFAVVSSLMWMADFLRQRGRAEDLQAGTPYWQQMIYRERLAMRISTPREWRQYVDAIHNAALVGQQLCNHLERKAFKRPSVSVHRPGSFFGVDWTAAAVCTACGKTL